MRLMRFPITLLAAVAAALLVVLTAAPAQAAIPDPDDDPTRVSPSTLRPRPSEAAADRPRVYGDGCHVSAESSTPTHCRYAERDGRRAVVVIGDSIAAQWWSSIEAAARAGEWKLVWMTKSACPAHDVTVRRAGEPYVTCDTWRRRALRKIRDMNRVDMVVMSGSARSTVLERGTLRPLTDPDERRLEWQRGTERTIEALAGQVRRVVVLRDTPQLPEDVPSCLVEHWGWTRVCSQTRSGALVAGAWAAERAAAEKYSWVRATEMTDRICRSDRCWPVTSDPILRYRDAHHLTDTFARALAPAMYSRLYWLMR